MKRLILSACLLALLPIAAPAAKKKAEPVPAQKTAGTIIAVVGDPQLSLDGGKTLNSVKIGQAVPVGSLIRTGEGKLSLLLSEGSVMHLASNSEITLTAHNPEEDGGGTLFGLARGFARFVVAKLQPGKHFEVATSNAVAAVKGTDFEAGIDENGNTDVNVFESATKGSVEMSDLDKLKSILIGENGSGSYDGKDFKSGNLDPAAVEKILEHYLGLPANPPTHGGDKADNSDQGGGKDNGGTFKTSDYVDDKGTEKNDKDVDPKADQIAGDSISQFVDKKVQDDKLDAIGQKDDFVTARTVVDHNGDMAHVTQSTVLGSDGMTLSNISAVSRNSGANAGNSFAIEVTDWNQPLPDHWATVVYRPLADPANLDAGGYPIYFRTFESFVAANPYGDTFQVLTNWHLPDFNVSAGYALEQGYSQTYVLNTTPVGTIDLAAVYDIDQHTSTNGLNFTCQTCTDDIFMNHSDNVATTQQGVDFAYYNNQKSPYPFLIEQVTLHDDNGAIFPTSGFSHPNAYSAPGLSDTYNTSVVFDTNPLGPVVFSHPIDLIFLPGFYQTFDMIQLPPGYGIQGGCGGGC